MLEQEVTNASADYVRRLSALSQEPYMREAVLKMAIREVAWLLLDQFEDRYALVDQLELMAQTIREHDARNGEQDRRFHA